MGTTAGTSREAGPAGVEAGAQAAISNLDELLSHGLRGTREVALRVAAAGLASCDPGPAVERSVALDGDVLSIDGVRYPLEPGGRIVVLGSGKASLPIAAALERLLGDALAGGTIVVRDASEASLERVEVLEAGHPVPDGRSVEAARRLLGLAEGLDERDLVIACFTGGSSALTSLAPPGVDAGEKRELHRLLLGSGLPITEINVVRKQVSAFKGGRLALAVAPARLANLTVSDVAGDPLDAITDPTVANGTTAAEAIELLRDNGLWAEMPASVRAHLEDGGSAQGAVRGDEIQTVLLVTGETACEAMAAEATAAGTKPVVLGSRIEQEAAAVGQLLGQLAAESATAARPFEPPVTLIACGGESTVRLAADDDFGAGGPNQEAALAAAERISGAEAAAVFLDTDGSDGGTAYAGGIVDGETAARAAAAGIGLRSALARHRSGDALTALGDTIETGATNTNVNDLIAVAVGAPR